ncbi:MAG: zf-HC2 domain-containing protein [Clostridiales bacterium]|nr:zf-HC2 domain-containing protein [Clostridiales bacterium]
MINQSDCGIVRDLLPNYIDGLTSQRSNEYVQDHLEKCNECKESYESMKMPIKDIDQAPEIAEFRGFLTKTKRMYLLGGVLLSLGSIAIFTTMLIDGILNHKFTWSLIVLASIIFVYAIGLTAMRSKKNKFIKSSLVFTILLFPLLKVISVESVILSGGSVSEWFFPYGFEIALLWTLILWISIGVWRFTQSNIWYGFAALFLLAIPCEFLMSRIISNFAPSSEPLWVSIIEIIVYSITSVLFGYMGKRSAKNNKKGKK